MGSLRWSCTSPMHPRTLFFKVSLRFARTLSLTFGRRISSDFCLFSRETSSQIALAIISLFFKLIISKISNFGLQRYFWFREIYKIGDLDWRDRWFLKEDSDSVYPNSTLFKDPEWQDRRLRSCFGLPLNLTRRIAISWRLTDFSWNILRESTVSFKDEERM